MYLVVCTVDILSSLPDRRLSLGQTGGEMHLRNGRWRRAWGGVNERDGERKDSDQTFTE